MGHIVNAKGMRLGWVSNWCDQWFSELQFYPEYLHSIYRIRFFLVYYFNLHPLEQRAFFFSHFNLIKIFKTLQINIYYYDGQAESIYSEFLFDYAIALKYDIDNDDPETKVWVGHYEPYKVLLIFRLFFYFNVGTWPSAVHKGFMKSILNQDLKYIKYVLMNTKPRNLIKRKHLLEKYLYFLLYFFNKALLKKSIYSRHYMESVLKRFFFIMLSSDWMYGLFFYVALVLRFILSMIDDQFNICIKFYAISNNCVNAKFLSRFIARKFAQNYRFYELINPIRRELRVVCQETKTSYRGYFHGKLSNFINYGKTVVYRKSIFKSFLTYIFIIYNKYSFKFFYKYDTWFSLNMVLIYIWINSMFNNNQKRIIKFSTKYIIRRGAFSYFFFFNFKNHINVFNKFFYLNKNSVISFLPKINFIGFFNFIYEDFSVNKNIIFFIKILLNKNMKYFCYAQYYFNRFMQYNFWMYNNGSLSLAFKYNMLKKRIFSPQKGGLIGFKMQCSGRFTRRQRASSIWFSYGLVPLNTISDKIDYSFFSIPIINSQITIKVWLHISKSYSNWYYNLI